MTLPKRVRSLSWTSQPRSMSANRNVRRGASSSPPTLGERAHPRHLRSGPYDIGVTRARRLDGGCRVIGQSQFLEATVAVVRELGYRAPKDGLIGAIGPLEGGAFIAAGSGHGPDQ
jgi:hypothetical protein